MFTSRSLTPIDRQLNKKVVRIIHGLLMMQQSSAFRKPVPHKALGLQDYKLIVKKPTDLNLIRRQNNQNKYKFVQEILDQIQLCWDNCKLYNVIGSEIYDQALFMENSFDKFGKQVLPDYWKDLNRDQYNQKFNQKKLEQEKLKKPEIINKSAKKDKEKQKEKVVDLPYQQTIKPKSKKVHITVPKYYQQNDDESEFIKKQKKQKIQKIQQQQPIQPQHLVISVHNQNKQQMQVQQDDEGHEIIQTQPIFINLLQYPSKQQLRDISNKVKSVYERHQYGVLQKMLQILHNSQKQHMSLNKNSQMVFNMNNIHISTYYRLKKLMNQIEEDNKIIQ